MLILAGWLGASCGGATPEPSAPETEMGEHPAAEPEEQESSPDEREAEAESPASDADMQTVLQLVIDDEELNSHLHLDEPGRFPFKISGSSIPSSVELVKGTQPVLIVTEPARDEAVLVFSEIKLGPSSGTLRFRYEVEGISGTASVHKGEYGWEVKRTRIVER